MKLLWLHCCREWKKSTYKEMKVRLTLNLIISLNARRNKALSKDY